MVNPLVLLRTEWLKLKHYRAFWGIVGLYVLCFGGVLAIALATQRNFQKMTAGTKAASTVAENLPFGFPAAWQSVPYLASWLFFIPALLLILIVCNEFTFRTHRQNLIEGWSRGGFLLSKLFLVIGISGFCTLVAGIGIAIAGVASQSFPTLVGMSYLGAFWLQSWVYGLVALMAALMIRRAALALMAYLAYVTILESFLRFLIDRQWPGYGAYLPLKTVNALLPVPFLKEKAPDALKAFLDVPDLPVLLGLTAFYSVAMIALMTFRFGREDL